MMRREKFEIAAIALFSFVLHLVAIDPTFNGPDAESNFMFAKRGQDWEWWLDPGAFWNNLFPMGYGSFLAVATRFTGGNFFPIQVLMAALGTSLALAGWLLTRHISKPARILTLAAIGLSPAVVWLARTNGYEIFLATLVTYSLTLLWWNGGQPPEARGLIVRAVPATAGLLMGLAMLTQGKVVVLMLTLGWLARRWGRRQFIAFIGSSAVFPAIWAFRNWKVLGNPYPFNSSSEIVIWMGNNWTTKTGEYQVIPPPLPEGMSSYYEASIRFIVSQPEMAYTLFLRRMAHLLEPVYFYPDLGQPAIMTIALHALLIVLSGIGVLLFAAYLFGRIWVGPPVLPKVGGIALFVMSFVLVHLPFATETRHLKPVVPTALAVAIPTAVALVDVIRQRKSSLSSSSTEPTEEPRNAGLA